LDCSFLGFNALNPKNALSILDGELVHRRFPAYDWLCPLFGQVLQGQIDQLGGRFIAREMTPVFDNLGVLPKK